MDKLIYELEKEFKEAFNDTIHDIELCAFYNKPMTLKEVIDFGFNNICFNGKYGYEEDDFTTEELQSYVNFNCWNSDCDGYNTVFLEPFEINMSTTNIGQKLKIIDMKDEPSYKGKTGVITNIDDANQIHGTWGGCAIIPDKDIAIIID